MVRLQDVGTNCAGQDKDHEKAVDENDVTTYDINEEGDSEADERTRPDGVSRSCPVVCDYTCNTRAEMTAHITRKHPCP